MEPNERVMLLSIRKPYSQLIMIGRKTFELRKRLPRVKCKYALIYETSPTKAIIGVFEISSILFRKVDEIWEMTKGKACISEVDFRNYYKNKDYGVAFQIQRVIPLDKKIKLSEIGVDYTPQDFAYVDKKELEGLIRI
jgi:predicted transcriptional regulator